MKQPVEIGITTLTYDVEGKPTSATFTPAVYCANLAAIKTELLRAPVHNEIEAQNNARVILSYWFTSVEGVELADREKGWIESELLECVKWENGRPKLCRMRFFFKYREGNS